MNHNLRKALYFLRLTDDNNVLSITHIACMVVLTKVALQPNPSIVDMGSLLITLSLYYGKKHMQKDSAKIAEDGKFRLDQIEQKVKEIQGQASSVSAHLGIGNIIKKN